MEPSYKYKYWVVTIKSHPNTPFSVLPDPALMVSAFKAIADTYTFQLEMSENNMYHYQCCMVSKIRKSQKTLLNDLVSELKYSREMIEVDRAFDYSQSVKYCSDRHKAVLDLPCYSTDLQLEYKDEDILFLDDVERRYPWQKKFMGTFFTKDEVTFEVPDDRKVFWIQDSIGNTGKSKFCKWLARRYPTSTKVAFGTSTQLRSAVISEGSKEMFMIDIPRTLGEHDSINSVVSVIEDIKNGYVKSGMYGESKALFMKPPHVVVFSNIACPIQKLSEDRWVNCYINYSKELVFC